MDLLAISLAIGCAAVLGAIAGIGTVIKATANRGWKIVGTLEIAACAALSGIAFLSYNDSATEAWIQGVALMYGMAGIACLIGEKRAHYPRSNRVNLVLCAIATGVGYWYIR